MFLDSCIYDLSWLTLYLRNVHFPYLLYLHHSRVIAQLLPANCMAVHSYIRGVEDGPLRWSCERDSFLAWPCIEGYENFA